MGVRNNVLFMKEILFARLYFFFIGACSGMRNLQVRELQVRKMQMQMRNLLEKS